MAALVTEVSVAETVIDFSAKHLVSGIRRTPGADASVMSEFKAVKANLVPVVITLDDENLVESIESLGIEPTAVEKNIVFARVTPEQIAALSEVGGVRRISGQRQRRIRMYNGRLAGEVDKVHNGDVAGGCPALTGKGVLVGIVDGGFDPNHIAFRTSDQSALRIKQLSVYKSDDEGKLTGIDTYSPSQIPSFTTDYIEDYHATHVSGIAAGAFGEKYRGRSYQGVAPDADIFMGALTNYSDDEVIRAAQDIRDMAVENGQPVVINMSLGINVGPHDGTDAFSVALDNIAKSTPVCIAAGNEADLDIVIKKTLTSADKTVRTSFTPNAYLKEIGINYQALSEVQVWSDDDTPFDVNVLIVDKSTGAVKSRYAVTTSYKEITPPSTYYNANKSFIECQKGLDRGNNRYCADIYMELLAKSSTWTTYPAIEVVGKAGQTIRMYNDGYYTEFATKRFSGYDEATPDGTINDMACGEHVIAVGSYNASVSGYPWTYYSSYGTLCDGRELPHVCAPGQEVVSAMSTPYYNSNFESPAASFDVNGKTYYYGTMSGTSMATPYMTGAAALWLEANPNLTPDEVRDIIAKSSFAPEIPEVKWGAGRLNVYQGAKLAYEMAGVVGVSADTEEPIIIHRIGEAYYEVFAPCAENPQVYVYDLSGRTVASFVGKGSTVKVDMSDLAGGVYIFNARGGGRSLTTKVAI